MSHFQENMRANTPAAESYHAGPSAITPAGQGSDAASFAGSANEFLNEKAVDDDTPFYKKRKYQLFCLVQTPIFIIVTVLLSIYAIFPAIAQTAVNQSHLNVQMTNITNPQNDTFGLSLQSTLTNAGPFPAKITFATPVEVIWFNNKIGEFFLTPVNIKGGHGSFTQGTQFNITDQVAFGNFSKYLITQPEFTWTLKAKLNIVALSIHKNGLTLNKDVTIKGLNSFNNSVEILDFQLPENDPAGGIALYVVTRLVNHSPFQIPLGFVEFGLSFNGTTLGPAYAINQLLVPGNNTIPLYGRLIPHTDQGELDTLGNLFTNYVNNDVSMTFAQGLAVYPDNKTAVGWLTEGIQALNLTVPLKPPQKLTLIEAIDIGTLNLAFTQPTAYAPVTSSDNITVHFNFPFGFSILFTQIANAFSLIDQQNNTLASLAAPFGPAVTNFTSHEIHLTLPQGTLMVPNHTLFQNFTYALTTSNGSGFNLSGAAAVKAMTPLGPILLSSVRFNVISSLLGLQGLRAKQTLINHVDVIGGTAAYLMLAVNTTIYNPSNLILSTGDVQFNLAYQNVTVGSVQLNNLTLYPGPNTVIAGSKFDPNSSPQGKQMLNDFVGHLNDTVNIDGYNGSTPIDSLRPALGAIALAPILPGLTANLIQSANVSIPTTIGNDHLARSLVTIANPFSGALTIQQINSNVTSGGIFVGAIVTQTVFPVGGNATAVSQPLPLLMNLNPGDIFSLLKVNAIKQGLNTAPLDALVELGGIVYTHAPAVGKTSKRGLAQRSLFNHVKRIESAAGELSARQTIDKRQNLDSNATSGGNSGNTASNINPAVFNGFNLPNFVLGALGKLEVDVVLNSQVQIGNYTSNLSFSQKSVPAGIDSSINNLLPVLGQPIVQKIVDGSVLSFSAIQITNPTTNAFATHLVGDITNTGPLAAVISFPSPLNISWNGQVLGSLVMPAITTQPNVGSTLNMDATFNVVNVDALTNFTKYLLNEPSFVWNIAAENVTVTALGATFTGILLNKQVTLNGMNRFNNKVIIESFNLPANDPAGGISLTLQTSLYNPSNVGVQVGNLGFNSFFGVIGLGPVAGSGVALAPQSINQIALAGRLVHQDTTAGTDALSTVFTNFIHGQNSSLSVQGTFAGPAGQTVTWLNEGITALNITGIQLPGQVFQVIKAVSLVELALQFTPAQAYSPPTSSDDTQASFYIPFGFPLNIVALANNISAVYKGNAVASLNVPQQNSVTDIAARVVTFGFNNIPFEVPSAQQGNFNEFTHDLTVMPSLTFGVVGTSDAVTNTAAGIITIKGIPINVQTTLAGLNGLNTKPAEVVGLDVTSGTPQALLITLQVVLFNPSNLTIGIGDTQFNLMYQGQNLGVVDIKGLTLVPGNNTDTALAYFSPQGGAVPAGMTLLENFVQGVLSTTQVQGSQDSTQVASLKDGLAAILLNTQLPALKQNLVTQATVSFNNATIGSNFGVAVATFTLGNPFTASVGITRVNATVRYNDLFIGQILLDTLSFNAAGHSTQKSDNEPILFNMNIPSLVRFVAEAAAASGTDISVLTSLFSYLPANDTGAPGITPAGPKKRAYEEYEDLYSKIKVRELEKRAFGDGSGDSPTNPNVIALTLRALQGLKVNLTLQSTVLLGEYQTDLNFNQYGVPALVDNSISYLIQYLGTPIVQNIVNGAILAFTQADLFNLRAESFDIHLIGSLANAGPVDAAISTPNPLHIGYKGNHIGDLTLPTIDAHGGQTTALDLNPAHFAITDLAAFTQFIIDSLHNPSFTWDVTGFVTVTAIGLEFQNVALTKSITLLAFNGLPGVKVTSFAAPSDAPDGNGIEIDIGTSLPNPAQIGITLGTITFVNYFEGVEVGPIVANNVTLLPQTTIPVAFAGQIIPQTTTHDQDAIGVLFSQYLAGIGSNLATVGMEVTPPGTSGTEVKWLNDGFKTLNLSVVLPGNSSINIVQSITIDDLELIFNPGTEVISSSQNTLAGYKNPFGFSLGIGSSSQAITLALSGQPPAVELDLPMAPAHTANNDTLFLSFTNKTLIVRDVGGFQALTAALTDTASANLVVNGSTSILALTKAGPIPITGIPIRNIQTSLKGINQFGGKTTLSNVNVNGGTSEHIIITLDTSLDNPSNLSVTTNDVYFDVHIGSPSGPVAGQAYIPTLVLKPGSNEVAAQFFYNNNVDAGAKVQLSNFLEGLPTDLYISGSKLIAASPNTILIPALQGTTLEAMLPGVPGPKLIQTVTATVDLISVITNPTGSPNTTVMFTVGNPLNTSLDILEVQNTAYSAGTTTLLGTFDALFSDGSFVAPGMSTTTGNPASPIIYLQNQPPTATLLGLLVAGGGSLPADINLVNSAKVGPGTSGFRVDNLLYSQKNVRIAVTFSAGGQTVPLSTVLQLAQLVTNLTALCTSPLLTSIPALGAVIGPACQAGAASAAALASASSAAAVLSLSQASAAASAAAAATSAAASVAAGVTSAAAGATSAAAGATSAAAAATSAAGGAVNGALSGLGVSAAKATPT